MASTNPVKYNGGVGYHQENIYDIEYNRAIARTLYVESTVNVVNAKSSKGKVRPGQMNLFSAKDLKKLGIKTPVKDAQEDEDIQ